MEALAMVVLRVIEAKVSLLVLVVLVPLVDQVGLMPLLPLAPLDNKQYQRVLKVEQVALVLTADLVAPM